MTAQPVHQEPDPQDPQAIHDLLPAAERAGFLHEYRAAVVAARDDVAKYRDLQPLLARWRLTADAAHDPAYRSALTEARAATAQGLTIDEVDAIRRAG